MTDLIVIAVVAAVIGGAVWYIIKSKKSGAKCIGCPSGGNCPHAGKGSCSCGYEENK